MRTEQIPLHLIDPPAHDDRAERSGESIAALAADIEHQGLINPVTLRRAAERFECVAGWTRCLAHRALGRAAISATIREDVSDAQTARLRFAENLQRTNLTPIEEAHTLSSMLALPGMNLSRLASIARRTEGWCEARLSLLELPEDLQAHIHAKTLSMASALILARCTDAAHRDYLTRYALNNGASANVLHEWLVQWQLAKESDPAADAPRPDLGAPAAPPIVYVRCSRCGEPHPYQNMPLIRLCHPCHEELTNANSPSSTI